MSAPGAVPASMAKRLLASVIDLAVVVVLGGGFVVAGVLGSLRLGGSVTSPTPLTVLGYVLLAAQGLVQWGLLATRGYTFGKGLVGLRVLSAATGQPLGPWRALVRLAIPALAWVVPVVGPALVHLSPLFDPSGRRQGWHDRAARDMVFDITIGVDPSVSSAPSAPEAARRFDALLSTTDDSVLGRVASTGPPRGVHLAPRVPQLVVSVPGRTDHDVDRAEQAGLGARPGEALAGALHDDDADTDPRRGSGTVALEHAGARQAADRSAGADSWTTAGAYHRGVPHSAARDLSQPSTPPGADQAAPAARRRAAPPD
ncbi:MAG: RDD family protein, partial [Cellulomonadaceae bacterium]|nr:RDD family protein [Cellulomonadaceae bacterium]